VWKNWVLALSAFCAFVVCSGALFWGLGKLVNLGFSGAGNKGSLIYAWESPEEHAANIAAAMNAKNTGASAGELRELNRFFTRVLETLAEEEQYAFRELVDIDAFAHRASLHPVAAGSDDFDQGELESQLEYDLEGPLGWARCQVVHVARGKAANEALVYVIFTSDGMSPTPYRWWLRRSGRNWSICDWEMIDLGQSEADRWARTHAIGYEGPAGKYWQAAASVTRAQDESGAGRHAAAAAQLKDAEKQQVSAELHDMNAIDIAFAWLDAGRPDLALAAADRAASPEFQIGAQQIRVQALAKLDRPDDLLAAMAKYRALAGCHPDLLRIEAQALEAAGCRKEAAECWWQSLRLMPDDRQSLFEFCRLAGSERQADIRQHLSKGKKPVERAAQAAREAIFQDEVAAAEAIVAYIREAEPDSTVLLSPMTLKPSEVAVVMPDSAISGEAPLGLASVFPATIEFTRCRLALVETPPPMARPPPTWKTPTASALA
jgi:hypothetical protein